VPILRIHLQPLIDEPGRSFVSERVKLDGFQMVISELEVEQDYLRPAMRYLEE
jgi:hypothetical protein